MRGIATKHEKVQSDFNEDDYILIPWKEGITIFEDTSLQLEKIDSTDVTDMLDVEFGINFWIELPEDVAAAYGKLHHS